MHDAPATVSDPLDDDIAVLARLRDICMRAAEDLGELIHAAAQPGSEVPDAGKAQLGQTLTRVARAIRQTIALKKRLSEDRQARLGGEHAKRAVAAKAQAAADAAQHAAAVEAARQPALKRGLANKLEAGIEVMAQIEAQARESDREDLLRDVRRFMDEYGDDDRFADMAIDDIIEHIRHEIAATPNWERMYETDRLIENLRDRRDDTLAAVGGPAP